MSPFLASAQHRAPVNAIPRVVVDASAIRFSDTLAHHSGTASEHGLGPAQTMTQPHWNPRIYDRASLEVWMTDMPREFVAVIATRAALRALPMLARDFTEGTRDELTGILLWSLRALSTASAGATWPQRVSEIWDIAAAAEPHVQTASSIAERGRHATAGRLCSAFEDALRLFVYPAGYILHSANATTAAAGIVGAGSWEAVSWDARQLPREWTGTGNAPLLAAGLYTRPLWPEDPPPQAMRAWADLKTMLPVDENWWVWTNWYEDHLAGRPPDQSLDFSRVTIPDQDWEHGPKHVNGIIANLMDPTTTSPRNSLAETPVASGDATNGDALRLVDQASIFDEMIDHPIPELPGELPSPLDFQFRDGALHVAEPPAPRLPHLQTPSVSAAWQAIATMLSDLHDDPSGRNNPALGRVLHACRGALGTSFDEVQPILLGVHACRLHELAERADEVLLPEAAAELSALSAQLALFLDQFTDWKDYSDGLARPFGTPESESRAARDGAAALAAIEEASPKIIAPEARLTLDDLQQATETEPSADCHAAVQPIAHRSWLRAVRNALRALSADALSSSRAGLRIGIKATVASATVLALAAAAQPLLGLARALPTEFGWLSRLVPYVQSLL